MRLSLATLCICCAHLAISQPFNDGKRDYVWLFGYGSFSQQPGFGRTVIDFSDLNSPHVYREDRHMDFNVTCSSVCDEGGNLLFYTNGIYIANAAHGVMENGLNLNPGGWTTTWADVGLPVGQGALTLPVPEKSQEYMLFHGLLDFPPGLGPIYSNLYRTSIDMELEGGLGAVIEKNVELANDTLSVGWLTATRHGNGRDWWVMIPKSNTSIYYTFLLTPDSLYNLGAQSVGAPINRGLGQAVFSPDGSRYLRYDLYAPGVGNKLNFYDFDRCTGLLSNQVELVNYDSVGAAGLAISANSRFAYFITSGYVRQYDLWAPDLAASLDTVGVYDGYVSPWGHHTWFYLAQLAPDNKIYINTPSSSNFLHIIHEPDRKGQACLLEQHGFEMPSRNAFTMPNFPYFRLGPLDGSPCDTLGIDNLPVAQFRYRKDTLSALEVEFTNLSYFEPTYWQWNFGDGNSSTEVNPIHVYAASGTYTVCLTVSNVYNSDTYCREVTVEGVSSSTQEITGIRPLQLYPNPASHHFTLSLPTAAPEGMQVRITNMYGREVALQNPAQMRAGTRQHTLDVSHLPVGVYWVSVHRNGGEVYGGKLVVQ
jgi:hypothetical protein